MYNVCELQPIICLLNLSYARIILTSPDLDRIDFGMYTNKGIIYRQNIRELLGLELQIK